MILPTVADARIAYTELSGTVVRTPVLHSELLDELVGTTVVAKAESLQLTGSFKVRGALNRIRTLPADAIDAGLLTVSAGNAALGVAYAAKRFGAAATVVMPENAVAEKRHRVLGYGARVVSDGVTDAVSAFERAAALQAREGLTFVHPFDDPMVIAGAATATMELLEERGDVSRLLVPCSGGGLLAGAILGARAVNSATEIIGVQPDGADGIRRSLAAGTPTTPDRVSTIADGLTAPQPGVHNFEMIRSAGVRVLTVPDEQIVLALGQLARLLRVVAEPAAAVGLAALLVDPSLAGTGTIGLLISGSNVSSDLLRRALALAEERIR